VPELVRWVSLPLWVLGFILLFIGRFGLGDSFRIGSPKESMQLKVNGLLRFSRNPMDLGLFATLLASARYTLNPILMCIGVFIAAVHHRIVLEEEQHLREAFGEEYMNYCSHVRRYL
jgi:protein-S-isoprenylcysteine O-methyltransferase Ste14